MREPLSPVDFRSPVGRLRLAKGRTTVVSGSAARSAAGTPSANAASSPSSYSSGASVGGPPDTQAIERPERAGASDRPNTAAGRRAPSHPSPRPDGRWSVRSSRRTGWSATEARTPRAGGERLRERPLTVETERLRRARSTCRRGSARSARWAAGPGSSMTKTPGPCAGTGRPQTAGPSAIRPTERSRPAASGVVVIARWYRWAARVIVPGDDFR